VLITAVVALALVAFAWAGYPVVATLLAWRRPRTAPAPHQAPRAVSVVMATRDAPAVVASRVTDLLSTAHPHEMLEVIVAVDITAASAVSDYAMLLPSVVTVVAGDAPGGKAVTLNAGVRAANAEIVIFADSAQRFDAAAISLLVAFLAGNEEFGAVCGGYRARPTTPEPWLLRAFWKLETHIRRAEARLHSLVAVTGAIYGIRRSLWRPLPAGLICDDLYVPLHVAASGFRVGLCEAALASDPRTFDRRQEFSRKVRTLTGLLQVCRWCPWVLVPGKNPLWLQFVSHKILRLATPYLLALGIVGLVPALAIRAGALETAAVLSLALLFLVGIARPALARRVLGQATWAIWLQGAPLAASLNAIRGRWDVWHPAPAQDREESLTAVQT
jgi:cellulose synthase/poly-beta-1,6-N-acetylglucosamine synthase-like glycosyltransferase